MFTYILPIIFLIIGFTLLIKGAHFLIEGAASIARKFKISDLVIGLTIVAFGTSAPEFFVNISASIKGSTDIAIGNILGSNIANILLILGICAVIYPLTLKKNTVWKEIPLSLLAAAAVGILANDGLLDGLPYSIITRADGIILLLFFIIFMYYAYGVSKTEIFKEVDGAKEESILKSILFAVGGIIALSIGGKLIVEGAVNIAAMLGTSEFLIGATIVAIGTGLPELATSIIAARKNKTDIAIGNIVGSNIFNIFWILGVSALIKPLPLNQTNNIDILMTGFASFILFAFLYINKKYGLLGLGAEEYKLKRWQGIAFITIYLGYISYLIARQASAI